MLDFRDNHASKSVWISNALLIVVMLRFRKERLIGDLTQAGLEAPYLGIYRSVFIGVEEVGFEQVAGVVLVSLAIRLLEGGGGVFLVEAKHHGDEEGAGAASGIADGVSGPGIEHFHHGGDDVARGAELAGGGVLS